MTAPNHKNEMRLWVQDALGLNTSLDTESLFEILRDTSLEYEAITHLFEQARLKKAATPIKTKLIAARTRDEKLDTNSPECASSLASFGALSSSEKDHIPESVAESDEFKELKMEAQWPVLKMFREAETEAAIKKIHTEIEFNRCANKTLVMRHFQTFVGSWMLKYGRLLAWYSTGSGKTCAAIYAIQALLSDPVAHKCTDAVVIVADPNALNVWSEHLEKCLSSEVYAELNIVFGRGKKNKNRGSTSRFPKIMMLSYLQFENWIKEPRSKGGKKRDKSKRPEIAEKTWSKEESSHEMLERSFLIIDEAHHIKDHEEIVKVLGRRDARGRHIYTNMRLLALTATPVLSGPEDADPLIRILVKEEVPKTPIKTIDDVERLLRGYVARVEMEGNDPASFADRRQHTVHVRPSPLQRFMYVYRARNAAMSIAQAGKLYSEHAFSPPWAGASEYAYKPSVGDEVFASHAESGFDVYPGKVTSVSVNKGPVGIKWKDGSDASEVAHMDVWKLLKKGTRIAAFRVSGSCFGVVKDTDKQTFNYIIQMDGDDTLSKISPFFVNVVHKEGIAKRHTVRMQNALRQLNTFDTRNRSLISKIWPDVPSKGIEGGVTYNEKNEPVRLYERYTACGRSDRQYRELASLIQQKGMDAFTDATQFRKMGWKSIEEDKSQDPLPDTSQISPPHSPPPENFEQPFDDDRRYGKDDDPNEILGDGWKKGAKGERYDKSDDDDEDETDGEGDDEEEEELVIEEEENEDEDEDEDEDLGGEDREYVPKDDDVDANGGGRRKTRAGAHRKERGGGDDSEDYDDESEEGRAEREGRATDNIDISASDNFSEGGTHEDNNVKMVLRDLSTKLFAVVSNVSAVAVNSTDVLSGTESSSSGLTTPKPSSAPLPSAPNPQQINLSDSLIPKQVVYTDFANVAGILCRGLQMQGWERLVAVVPEGINPQRETKDPDVIMWFLNGQPVHNDSNLGISLRAVARYEVTKNDRDEEGNSLAILGTDDDLKAVKRARTELAGRNIFTMLYTGGSASKNVLRMVMNASTLRSKKSHVKFNMDGVFINTIVLQGNAFKESFSLMNIGSVHIAEVGETPGDEKQAIGRAIRLCSHSSYYTLTGTEGSSRFPPVRVFTYVADLSTRLNEPVVKHITKQGKEHTGHNDEMINKLQAYMRDVFGDVSRGNSPRGALDIGDEAVADDSNNPGDRPWLWGGWSDLGMEMQNIALDDYELPEGIKQRITATKRYLKSASIKTTKDLDKKLKTIAGAEKPKPEDVELVRWSALNIIRKPEDVQHVIDKLEKRHAEEKDKEDKKELGERLEAEKRRLDRAKTRAFDSLLMLNLKQIMRREWKTLDDFLAPPKASDDKGWARQTEDMADTIVLARWPFIQREVLLTEKALEKHAVNRVLMHGFHSLSENRRPLRQISDYKKLIKLAVKTFLKTHLDILTPSQVVFHLESKRGDAISLLDNEIVVFDRMRIAMQGASDTLTETSQGIAPLTARYFTNVYNEKGERAFALLNRRSEESVDLTPYFIHTNPDAHVDLVGDDGRRKVKWLMFHEDMHDLWENNRSSYDEILRVYPSMNIHIDDDFRSARVKYATKKVLAYYETFFEKQRVQKQKDEERQKRQDQETEKKKEKKYKLKKDKEDNEAAKKQERQNVADAKQRIKDEERRKKQAGLELKRQQAKEEKARHDADIKEQKGRESEQKRLAKAQKRAEKERAKINRENMKKKPQPASPPASPVSGSLSPLPGSHIEKIQNFVDDEIINLATPSPSKRHRSLSPREQRMMAIVRERDQKYVERLEKKRQGRKEGSDSLFSSISDDEDIINLVTPPPSP